MMFTRAISTVVTGTALGLAAITGTGIAAADNTYTANGPALNQRDATFLSQITGQAIGFTSPQVAVADAQLICQALSGGQSGVAIGQQMLKDSNLTVHQVAFFVYTAVTTYCPQNAGQLNA
jgi:hypothetical protein